MTGPEHEHDWWTLLDERIEDDWTTHCHVVRVCMTCGEEEDWVKPWRSEEEVK